MINPFKKNIVVFSHFVFTYLLCSVPLYSGHNVASAQQIATNYESFLNRCIDHIAEGTINSEFLEKNQLTDDQVISALNRINTAQVITSAFLHFDLVYMSRGSISLNLPFSKQKIDTANKLGGVPDIACYYSRSTDEFEVAWRWYPYYFSNIKSKASPLSDDEWRSLVTLIKKISYNSWPIYRFEYKKIADKWALIKLNIEEYDLKEQLEK